MKKLFFLLALLVSSNIITKSIDPKNIELIMGKPVIVENFQVTASPENVVKLETNGSRTTITPLKIAQVTLTFTEKTVDIKVKKNSVKESRKSTQITITLTVKPKEAAQADAKSKEKNKNPEPSSNSSWADYDRKQAKYWSNPKNYGGPYWGSPVTWETDCPYGCPKKNGPCDCKI